MGYSAERDLGEEDLGKGRIKGLHNPIVKRFIAHMTAPPTYLNPSYTVFSETEGQRDFKIQQNINEMNFRGLTVNAVYNKLVSPNVAVKKAAYFDQLVMDWNNHFMVTPNQAERLNNPAHASFVSQRQLTVPNAYGQFYAFMRALSAAFGTLQG